MTFFTKNASVLEYSMPEIKQGRYPETEVNNAGTHIKRIIFHVY
jgi:hypothetical protein